MSLLLKLRFISFRHSSKYQSYNLWFDSSTDQTHKIPLSRRARTVLHSRCHEMIKNKVNSSPSVIGNLSQFVLSCLGPLDFLAPQHF